MRQVGLKYYYNESGTYLFIPQRVLHGVLRSKREKCGYITTYCTNETCIFAKTAKHKARVHQLDFIGAFFQAKVKNRVFVKLDSRYAD